MSGCITGIGWVGNSYIENSGLHQAADTNNAVLVFPQTLPIFTNPLGCWVWWKYLMLSGGGIWGTPKDMPLPQRGAFRCKVLLPCYIVAQELPHKRTPTKSD